MHDIERYGIGKSELATWRDARQATLLFAAHGESVTLTLLADGLVTGRHTVPANHFAEALSSYAHWWQTGSKTGANVQQRSFVTAYDIAGQGVDPGVAPHPGPRGFPGENYLLHQLAKSFVALVNPAREQGLGQERG